MYYNNINNIYYHIIMQNVIIIYSKLNYGNFILTSICYYVIFKSYICIIANMVAKNYRNKLLI